MYKRVFCEKGISQEVSRDALGHVSKECDKQGFPMTQGVLTSGGVKLLIYRASVDGGDVMVRGEGSLSVGAS